MTFDNLLRELGRRSIELKKNDNDLEYRGAKDALDNDILSELRSHKSELLYWLGDEVNTWSTPQSIITPEMLPLVRLTQEEIDIIIESTPGGASNIQDIYPLAPLQEGILFHHLMGEERDVYVLSSLMAFNNRKLLDKFLSSFQSVINRHDILRTAILWENLPEPVQVVWRNAEMSVEEVRIDLSACNAVDHMMERYSGGKVRIDIRKAPMMRVFIAKDDNNERWILALLFHHLIMDHTTLEIFYQEVGAYIRGEESLLPEALPFRNYIAQARLGVSKEEHEAFFKKMLSDVEEPTAPYGMLDVRGDGSDVGEVRYNIDISLSLRLRNCARKMQVSAASLFHLAWARLLGSLSNRDDVVFGTVLFGRMQGGEEAERVMGMFINTLPVRIVIKYDGVEAAIKKTHRILTELLHHEYATLTLAQRCSGVPSPTPLFSSLLNYRYISMPVKGEKNEDSGMGIESLYGEERTNYPFVLSVNDLGEGFSLTAQIQRPIDPNQVCRYMNTVLENLADALENAPYMTIGNVDVLSETELNQILYEWNETKVEYLKDKCIHELFEEQVEKTPDAVAVLFEGQQLSYRELNIRSNQLAHYLVSLGVRPEALIGLCMERSLEIVMGLLGILKAGGAYIPLDPKYPEDRLAFIIEESQVTVILTQEKYTNWLSGKNEKELSEDRPILISLDTGWDIFSQENEDNTVSGIISDNLSYVIYTSGSTGKPKGVQIMHQSLVNFLFSMSKKPGLSENDILLSVTTLSFDIAALEIYLPLISGAKVVLIKDKFISDGSYLLEKLEKNNATVMQATPATWRILLATKWDGNSNLKILCGGEALPRGLADALLEKGKSTWNLYGPTETTIWSSSMQVEPPGDRAFNGSIESIGRPIDNTQMYILDECFTLVPIEIDGELIIGGDGLARNYYNRSGLTAERFIPNPFANKVGSRLYKTGDLARYLPDGTIDFIGRNDHQVKVRGFRIELGEIESRLSEIDGINEGVVIAREDIPGEKRLVAYYTVIKGRGETTVEEIRSSLSRHLPDYMVPSAYVELEEIPLTPNGKTDRKSLPAPEGDVYARGVYEEPMGELEEALAGIWSEVLNVDQVGRNDNFFDLGGHSLLAIKVISRIKSIFFIELSLSAMFEAQNIEELSLKIEKIREKGEVNMLLIEPVSRENNLPLSFAQERLWVQDKLVPDNPSYNISMPLRIKGQLRVQALKQALVEIVRRHETLRTRFEIIDGMAVQVIDEKIPFLPNSVDLESLSSIDKEKEASRIASKESLLTFNLEKDLMLRARLLLMNKEEYVLLLTMHHIASDGWSMGILEKEHHELYNAYSKGESSPLPELQIQYADYAVWQRKWLSGELLDRQLAYWRKQLTGIQTLNMPTDYVRPVTQIFLGNSLPFHLKTEVSQKLQLLGHEKKASLYMILLTAFTILLSRYSGQEDIAVGSVTANRNRKEIENLIGFFINTLVMRVDLSGDPTFCELLERVRKISLDANDHQDLPFEKLVEELHPERSLSNNPFFQVMFIFESRPNMNIGLADLTLSFLRYQGSAGLRSDLDLYIDEISGEIMGSVVYNPGLFKAMTISRMIDRFQNLLEDILNNPHIPIDDISIANIVELPELGVNI